MPDTPAQYAPPLEEIERIFLIHALLHMLPGHPATERMQRRLRELNERWWAMRVNQGSDDR